MEGLSFPGGSSFRRGWGLCLGFWDSFFGGLAVSALAGARAFRSQRTRIARPRARAARQQHEAAARPPFPAPPGGPPAGLRPDVAVGGVRLPVCLDLLEQEPHLPLELGKRGRACQAVARSVWCRRGGRARGGAGGFGGGAVHAVALWPPSGWDWRGCGQRAVQGRPLDCGRPPLAISSLLGLQAPVRRPPARQPSRWPVPRQSAPHLWAPL